MKKQYMWKVKVKSQYSVETLLLCKEKSKLVDELQQEKYKDFNIGKIEKSNRYFVTDGNTEIHYRQLYW